MTTINVDTTLVQKPQVSGSNITGFTSIEIPIPNISVGGTDSVSSVTVTRAGTNFTAIPSVVFTANDAGQGAAATAVMEALTVSPSLPQSGSGSYAPGDTITFTGGTGTQAIATVTTTQVMSATIAAAGTGGTNGTQMVTGTTGTGTKFVAIVTVSGGEITAIQGVDSPGEYTVNPTVLTAEPVTGGGLSGAELNIKMGVFAGTISTPGAYSVLPTSPVAQGSTSGSGTGFTGILIYGVNSVPVNNGGFDYTVAPNVSFTGGGGSGATATANLSGTNSPYEFNLAFLTPLPNTNYTIAGMGSQACSISSSNKTIYGCTVTITPLSGSSLSSGTIDLLLSLIN